MHDFKESKTTELRQLVSNPFAMKSFLEAGLVVIGDYVSGEAIIYQFNEITESFSLFLILSAGKVKDNLLGIEMLKDKTLWLQYVYKNYFFSIQDCLEDVNKCLSCTHENYFSLADNSYDWYGVFGTGTQLAPFTSPTSFFTAFLNVNIPISDRLIDEQTNKQGKLSHEQPRHECNLIYFETNSGID